ncbi:MAG: GNAT family N-acetyltransferase [Alphaproteobacteria bacterium]
MDKVVIRRAELRDAGAMSAYVGDIVAESLDTIALDRLISPEEEVDYLRKIEAAERAFFMLALDGERVVGMLDIWAGGRANDRHAGRLGMSVARDWRGRGVGRRLMQAAIAEARKWDGFRRIELDVVSWNEPAIALYESLGFVVEGRREKAINLRGEPEDTLLMALVW